MRSEEESSVVRVVDDRPTQLVVNGERRKV